MTVIQTKGKGRNSIENGTAVNLSQEVIKKMQRLS
jgi:hypothetical protein